MLRLQRYTTLMLLAMLLMVGSTVVRAAETKNGFSVYHHTAPLGIRYTRNHPLIIVADWSFKPFSYVNDYGEPDGFIVELITEMFSRVHVPYEIRMMDYGKVREELRTGRAHLAIDVFGLEKNNNLHYSHVNLAEYKPGVMHLDSRKNMPSILLLGQQDSVYTFKGSYSDNYLESYFKGNYPFYKDNMEAYAAIHRILSGQMNYYAGNKHALLSLIRKYGVEGKVVVEDIDIPSGQMRFLSSDRVLLLELDEQFQRIVSSGRYQIIHDKWFLGKKTSEANFTDILLIVAFLVVLVIIIITFILLQRSNATGSLKKEFLSISHIGIDLTNCQLYAMKVSTQWVHNLSGSLVPEKGMSIEDFIKLIHPADRALHQSITQRVDSGEKDMPDIVLRIRRYNEEPGKWRTMKIYAKIKQNKRKKPTYVYLAMIDETDRMTERQQLDRSLREFSYITNISELGMAYYDAEGHFVNGNGALYNLFNKGGLDKAEQFLQKTTLQELPIILNGITIERIMNVWFCGPIDIQELNLRAYAEIRIQSVLDKNGKHQGYAIAFMDLDNDISIKNAYRGVADSIEHMKTELTRYHMEMRFILRKNNIVTFRCMKGSEYIESSTDLLSFDRRTSIHDYIENVEENEREQARYAFEHFDEVFSKPQRFYRRMCNGKDSPMTDRWLIVSSMPSYDEEGNFCGITGIFSDVTQYMSAQQSLREETEKANNSGKQKSIFLANMTHELRTPLNAINGFAEVLRVTSTPEEKAEYVKIMLHNCTMLISLIDNILQLSMLDTDGIRLHHDTVDFAKRFPQDVRKMERYIISPDVQLRIDTPIRSLMLNIDYERILQIIDAFVNNASKNTTKGYIRVGYCYNDGILIISCRDSGCGIPQDRQQDIFNRFVKLNDFVQGSGLGLSVCQILAQAMHGHIDVYSREGQGSTFTLTVEVAE